jgi:hypothetical protein
MSRHCTWKLGLALSDQLVDLRLQSAVGVNSAAGFGRGFDCTICGSFDCMLRQPNAALQSTAWRLVWYTHTALGQSHWGEPHDLQPTCD